MAFGPMQEPEFDVAALLAPIAGEAPAGSDPREDTSPQSLYYRLRDARAEARAAERAMESETSDSAPPPQWGTVRELTQEVLAERAKDLEIAAWLTEALLRSDGVKGLASGIRVMAGLVESFWEDLFPLPDEEGVATRVIPVAGLNGFEGDGTLIAPLRRLALFSRPDGGVFQLWQYEQSTNLATIVDEARQQQRLAAGVVPFETVETEARFAGSEHFAILRQEAGMAAEAWRALEKALDERAGGEAPPMGRVRDLLQEIGAVAERFAGPEGSATAVVATEKEGGAVAQPVSRAEAPPLPVGVIKSREEALRALANIAAYFHRAEPLSPLAYTLEEAVRRAHLSWPQLLEEIVPDFTTRSAILTSLGIRPPSEET